MYIEKLKSKLNKLLQGNFFGMFQSIFKGEGLEIEDVRPYVWGDDIRYINWKISAKYNKLFVNVFRQEKDIDLHLFLDLNLNFLGKDIKSNIEIVSDFLTDLFIFSKKNGINVLGFLPDFGEKKIKVYRLGTNLEKMYFFLKEFSNQTYSLKEKRYISYIDKFLDFQKKFFKRHVILMVGDFLNLNEKDIKVMNALSFKNEIILFQLPILASIGRGFNFLNNIKDLQSLNGRIKRYKLI